MCRCFPKKRPCLMFAVLSRPIQRRAIVHSARWMSQKPPSKSLDATPKPETPKEPKPETPEGLTEPSSQPGSAPSLDFSPPENAASIPQQERTGARSSKGTLSSSEKRRQRMGMVSFGLLGLSLGLGLFFVGREWEEDELKMKKLVRLSF